MLRMGDVVVDEHGNRYIVRSLYPFENAAEIAYGLTLIPEGLSAMDLGRQFRPSPTPLEPQAFMLMIPTS